MATSRPTARRRPSSRTRSREPSTPRRRALCRPPRPDSRPDCSLCWCVDHAPAQRDPRSGGWAGACGRLDLVSAEDSRNVALADAGWSSSVARRAHNPEVAGSNPAPATNRKADEGPQRDLGPFVVSGSLVAGSASRRAPRQARDAAMTRVSEPCSAWSCATSMPRRSMIWGGTSSACARRSAPRGVRVTWRARSSSRVALAHDESGSLEALDEGRDGCRARDSAARRSPSGSAGPAPTGPA